MKPGMISNSITLHFANIGVKDQTSLIRCNIFAMDIENLYNRKELSLDAIKTLSSYHGVMNNVVDMDDDFLMDIIEKVEQFVLCFN